MGTKEHGQTGRPSVVVLKVRNGGIPLYGWNSL